MIEPPFIAIVIIVIICVIAGFIIYKIRPSIKLTDEFREIIHLLNETKTNVFVSGKAGTGKSTLLRYFINNTNKQYVVLAPTGIAAINVRGQTIHSFFRLPPKLIKPGTIKVDYSSANLFKKIEILIIDEISMVRADVIDAIDESLRLNRNRPNEPFGGAQVVFFGDIFQLPPVVPRDLESYFSTFYKGPYFFNARVFSSFQYKFKELSHVFRQTDSKFIDLLNRIRVNNATFEDFVHLNSRYTGTYAKQSEKQRPFIYLTTTNAIVKNINSEQLKMLEGEIFEFKAEATGALKKLLDDELSNPNKNTRLPAEAVLKLKRGAQVMMIKNDKNKRWVNGTIGKVERCDADSIIIRINDALYEMEKENWEKVEYQLNQNTDTIEARTTGTFKQFPLKLAWAITIHKSQGQTFDSVLIDIGSGAFAHGQTYVALSRCKSLAGITLNKQIHPKDIIVDQRVSDYYENALSC